MIENRLLEKRHVSGRRLFMMVALGVYVSTTRAQVPSAGDSSRHYPDSPQHVYRAVKSHSFEGVMNINLDDITLGINASQAVWNRYGISLIEFIHLRPYRKSMLVQQDRSLFYQFREFRYLLGLGMRKDFFLGNGTGLYLDVSGTWSGGDYAGTAIRPEKYFSPAGGAGVLTHLGRGCLFRFGYMFSPLYRDNPHRFSFGLDFNILRKI